MLLWGQEPREGLDVRMILDAVGKTVKLWFLRRRMRLQAREMLWLRDQVSADRARLEKLEARQRSMQGTVWSLEAPGSLIKHSYSRPRAGSSTRGF